ncbi:unnamed protein product, partial [Brenthis ino]
MLRIAMLCFLVLQVVTSEPPPLKCGPAPKLKNPLDCCPLPEVFKEEDYNECGLKIYFDDDGKVENRTMEEYCNKLKCLLNKYNLMKDETSVDKEAVGTFMDKWADTNEDFRDAVEIAKNKCLKEDLSKIFEEGYELCQPSIFVYCTSVTVYSNCPIWKDMQICKDVKEFMDDCKPFFP